MNDSDRVETDVPKARPGRSRKVEAKRSAARVRTRLSSVAFVVLIVSSVACLGSAQVVPNWRYDLRPGDHLTYRYTFQRRMQSKEDQTQTQIEARFLTHMLVVGANANRISIGFQRNREAAELTESISKGKNTLAKETLDFQKRMRTRPSHFSEAMEVTLAGEPLYPWEMARETYSHLIEALHEVMNLPPSSPTKGVAWQSSALPGMNFRWTDDESIHSKLCHRIEGVLPDQALKLTYWWSPESGVLEQVALEGNYSDGGTTHETARMELESRTRGESLENWLASSDTRLGALQAILLSNLPISTEELSPVLASVLASNDPAAQALALAIVSRRKIKVPLPILTQLRQSTNAGIKSQLQSLDEPLPNSPPPLTDECHRPLPLRSQPLKFGTALEVTTGNAPNTDVSNNKDNRPISYLLRTPLSYRQDRPSPLLVYLSGGAGFAIDGMYSAENIVSQTDYLVLYPQAAAYWWTPETAVRFNLVLNDVLQRYNVDRDRIYISGFSNGGTGALYYATLWPQRFAAVVTQMGAGQCNEQVKAGLANVRNIPLLLVHGENDTTITPDCSTATQAALSELHPAIEPILKILPKHGHDITLQSDEGLTLAFFQDKVRNPFPRTVELTETDALASRAYWIEILDGIPGKSDLDVRVKADNTIDIHSHAVKSIRLYLRPELLPRPGDFRIVWNGKKLFSGPLRDSCSLPPSPITGDPKLDQSDKRDLSLP